MKDRDELLLQLRPQIESAVVQASTLPDEQFQNLTLRPVILLQNDLLLEAFRNYVQKHKNVFYDMSIEKRMAYIENAVQKDMKFRNSLKGMIIGQFTLKEYSYYITNSSALNKCMMDLVKNRLQSNIQLLDKLSAV
ncbi:glyoxalase [Salinimicrobium tongyeongense]|uniref:Glyoxalase n=1 Tax=Salinimicrobium tongyeongense TaxID=2809707 RepID=A0ABY6NQ79_9FLAO|nr:glyoxalase [Salinimicrobium tongyeongense]UZH55039.1 glyoxalase [Salinimicrobium tongyeongense]